jgi:hypothetical protein
VDVLECWGIKGLASSANVICPFRQTTFLPYYQFLRTKKELLQDGMQAIRQQLSHSVVIYITVFHSILIRVSLGVCVIAAPINPSFVVELFSVDCCVVDWVNVAVPNASAVEKEE